MIMIHLFINILMVFFHCHASFGGCRYINARWIVTCGGGYRYLPKYPTVSSQELDPCIRYMRQTICHQNQPNVGKYIIHGPYGI